MQGTVHISSFAGQSFLIDTGQDFTTWAGESGNTPYMIIVTDSSGKQAVGYLGEEGTGYTYNNNIVTNGSMEELTDWASKGTPTTNERSPLQVRTGTYSRHVVTNGVYEGIYQNLTFSVGKLYKCESWWYPDTQNLTYYIANTGLGYTSGDLTLVLDIWQELTCIATAVASSGNHELYNRDNPVSDFYIDNVSVLEILTPPMTSGIRIYSSPDGSTQSWAVIESGFDPNAVASYRIVEAY